MTQQGIFAWQPQRDYSKVGVYDQLIVEQALNFNSNAEDPMLALNQRCITLASLNSSSNEPIKAAINYNNESCYSNNINPSKHKQQKRQVKSARSSELQQQQGKKRARMVSIAGLFNEDNALSFLNQFCKETLAAQPIVQFTQEAARVGVTFQCTITMPTGETVTSDSKMTSKQNARQQAAFRLCDMLKDTITIPEKLAQQANKDVKQ